MNIYVINVCVDTKTTDIYDKVAVNKHPILISCFNEDRLKDILNQSNMREYIKQTISKQLYGNAQYYIVRIDEDGGFTPDDKMVWDLKNITKIEWEA